MGRGKGKQAGRRMVFLGHALLYWGCSEKVLLTAWWGNPDTSVEAAYSGGYYLQQTDIETNHNRYLNEY